MSEAPVKVSVYYESLCPDSQLFVYNQLAPTFEIFGPEELAVDLKPFGKANVIIHGNVILNMVYVYCIYFSGLKAMEAGTSLVSTDLESATTTRSRLAS